MSLGIVSYLESRGCILTKDGPRWKTFCPFHEENNPSFTCYETDTFYCFSCGITGNLFDLIGLTKFGKKPWTKAQMSEILGMTGSTPTVQPKRKEKHVLTTQEKACLTVVYDLYRKSLYESQSAINYVKSRGVHHIAQLPIGYCKGTSRSLITLMDLLKKEVGEDWYNIATTVGILRYGSELGKRIFIVEVRKGEVQHYQARTVLEDGVRYIGVPNVRGRLLGTESILPSTKTVFIVEGPFDMLPILDKGGAAICLLGSTVLEPELMIELLKGKEAAIATDWDGFKDGKPLLDVWNKPIKGELAARKVMSILKEGGISYHRVRQPYDCKDIGEWALRNEPLSELDKQA